jgi:hypothetical protein
VKAGDIVRMTDPKDKGIYVVAGPMVDKILRAHYREYTRADEFFLICLKTGESFYGKQNTVEVLHGHIHVDKQS